MGTEKQPTEEKHGGGQLADAKRRASRGDEARDEGCRGVALASSAEPCWSDRERGGASEASGNPPRTELARGRGTHVERAPGTPKLGWEQPYGDTEGRPR